MSKQSRQIWIVIVVLAVPGGASAANALSLGNEAFAEGRIAEAVTHYQQALRDRPTLAAQVNLGHCYMRLEQWAAAVAAYQAAIHLDKETVTPDVWRFLGQAQYALEQVLGFFFFNDFFNFLFFHDLFGFLGFQDLLFDFLLGSSTDIRSKLGG